MRSGNFYEYFNRICDVPVPTNITHPRVIIQNTRSHTLLQVPNDKDILKHDSCYCNVVTSF